MDLKRILVPLDGSALAESALPAAVDLAAKTSTTLVLLRAAEAHVFPGADPVDAQVAAVREAEEYLATAAGRARAAGMERVETAVWYGPPAAAIVEAVEFQKPDLLVMTTHGRSGLGRLIMGSVAESVLRATTTPILLLRSPEAPVQRPAPGGAAPREA